MISATGPLDERLWLALGAECDNAPAPNDDEDDYAAGYVAGLAKAQQIMRRMLKAELPLTEYVVDFDGSAKGPEDTFFKTAEEALAVADGNEALVFVRQAPAWAPAFPVTATKGVSNV